MRNGGMAMRLIFEFGTCHLCGLNSDFRFLQAALRAACALQSLFGCLVFLSWCMETLQQFCFTCDSTDEGPENVTGLFCSSLLFIEHSLTYYPKCHRAKSMKRPILTAHTYQSSLKCPVLMPARLLPLSSICFFFPTPPPLGVMHCCRHHHHHLHFCH